MLFLFWRFAVPLVLRDTPFFYFDHFRFWPNADDGQIYRETTNAGQKDWSNQDFWTNFAKHSSKFAGKVRFDEHFIMRSHPSRKITTA
jgi:hypothetical protein